MALVLALFAACDDGSKPPLPAPNGDAGLELGDAGAEPVDAGDGAFDAGLPADEDGGLHSTCEGACRDTTLSVRVGDVELPLDRVQFGFTSPQKSRSQRWELFLEAHAGGDPACPVEGSPTPDRTLVISGVVVPVDATEQTKSDGLSLVLLDFRGDLTDEPALRAETISMRPTAANLCPECVADGGLPEDAFLSFELTAAFAGADGGVGGHGHARYCESMNDL